MGSIPSVDDLSWAAEIRVETVDRCAGRQIICCAAISWGQVSRPFWLEPYPVWWQVKFCVLQLDRDKCSQLSCCCAFQVAFADLLFEDFSLMCKLPVFLHGAASAHSSCGQPPACAGIGQFAALYRCFATRNMVSCQMCVFTLSSLLRCNAFL